MDALYREVVFDEWVVVALSGRRVEVVFYAGPRTAALRAQFVDDVQPLREELEGRRLDVGGFVFSLQAAGTAFDACVRLGAGTYLLCNHTARSMDEIRARPRWLEAQKAFVQLTETFHADPVV